MRNYLICIISYSHSAPYLHSSKCVLDGVFNPKYFLVIRSERRARARGPHGERKAEKDPQAEDDLLQLPARCSAETLPEGAVPRTARESGAGGSARPHSDTGELIFSY